MQHKPIGLDRPLEANKIRGLTGSISFRERSPFGVVLLMGLAAAYLSSLTHYIIQHWTHAELEFTIMGFSVGKTVLWASSQQRTRRYRWLAVVLTYAAIATTYIPKIGHEMMRPDTPWQDPAESKFDKGRFGPLPAQPVRVVPTLFKPKSVYDYWIINFDNFFRQHIRPLPFWKRVLSFWSWMFGLALIAPFLYGKVGLVRLGLILLALLEAWRLNRPLEKTRVVPTIKI